VFIEKTNICIIPAKGKSERLPGKNIKKLHGKTLLSYTVEAAKQSALFDDIVVSTNSEDVARIALKCGARVPYNRPLYLDESQSGVANVCLDMLKYLKTEESLIFENTFILLPTSPFRKPEYLHEAYKLFCNHPEYKVLMSVTELSYPPFWALVRKKGNIVMTRLFGSEAKKRRHELPKTYKPDGMVMILRTEDFITQGNYEFEDILTYQTPGYGVLDINTPDDFAFAEFLLKRGDVSL